MTNSLENRRTLTRSVGSNPTPSAYFKPFAESRPGSRAARLPRGYPVKSA